MTNAIRETEARGSGSEVTDTVDGVTEPDGSTSSYGNASLSLDMIFEILKNYRRRQVLRYLDRNRGEATLDTLAGLIAAEENGIDAAEVTSSQRKRVYISLYQSHLPKMDDVGVIDYDRNRGRIELTDASEYLFPYLYLHSTEYSTQTDDSWRSIGWIHSKIRDALSNGIALGRRER